MIGWICVRQSLLLSDWLFRILKKLNNLNKNSVLIEVSHLTIEKVKNKVKNLSLHFLYKSRITPVCPLSLSNSVVHVLF